jgi:uncharacterized protein YjiS (DUF1127 family)
MTSKTITRKSSTAAPFAPIGRAVAALPMGLWRLVVAINHRRELAHLADFDDQMLADIGLTRTDLRDAYAEPLWRDPTSMLARRAAERRACSGSRPAIVRAPSWNGTPPMRNSRRSA